MLSTINEVYSNIGDSLDSLNFKPDFQVLVSLVVSLVSHYHKGSREALLGNSVSEGLAHQFSIERKVSRDTPPCFWFMTITANQLILLAASCIIFH